MSALRLVVNEPTRRRTTKGRQWIARPRIDEATALREILAEFPRWRTLGRHPTLNDYLALLPSMRGLPSG